MSEYDKQEQDVNDKDSEEVRYSLNNEEEDEDNEPSDD